MRILLYTGKGGVGKSTVAAATGMTLARRGLKTLVMSVDAAHSLADAFDLDVRLTDKNRGEPLAVEENLWIQEVDVTEEIERHWKEISGYITTLLAVTGVEEVLAEELAIFPGMEEVSALLYVNRYAKENAYDALILDCAPTGESLRFVSLPPTLDWYMRKLFRLERRILKVARPVLEKAVDIPLPADRYFENIQALAEKLDGVDALLKDPAVTTVRLVTNPEKIVIRESRWTRWSSIACCRKAWLIRSSISGEGRRPSSSTRRATISTPFPSGRFRSEKRRSSEDRCSVLWASFSMRIAIRWQRIKWNRLIASPRPATVTR